MTGLLRLLKEGRAWSVEELAGRLETSQEDIRRQVEYLEHTGFLADWTAWDGVPRDAVRPAVPDAHGAWGCPGCR